MKKSHKTALKIAGAGVAVAAVAAAASYITTKILVMVALDRNPPKLPGKAAGAISGSAFDNKDFISDVEKYAKLLENFPPDVVCMGIGENGHIAFNDPPVADFNDPKVIKKVKLDEICRMQQVHDGCFATIDDVPKYALTLTVPTLMSAKFLICTVPAITKANAVKAMLYGEYGEVCPATSLRTHEGAKMFLDKDSASLVL